MKTIAIMQPTFFPWIGYFSMIDRVDEFIYLDSVQFSRRSWQQRNRIKTPNGELILTVPIVSKGKRDQLILDATIDLSSRFGDKHWCSIENAYRNAPYFIDNAPKIKNILLNPPDRLAELNIAIIETLCETFEINTPRKRSSMLNSQGNKATLLARICKETGSKTYISALGSKEYIQESDAFIKEGVDVIYHEYVHPTYFQGKGEFLPYMSAIDLLFNIGAKESISLIRSGLSLYGTENNAEKFS